MVMSSFLTKLTFLAVSVANIKCLKLQMTNPGSVQAASEVPKTIVCGYAFEAFRRAVFPDLAHLSDRAHAKAQDIMIASGKQCKYRGFPGKVLYLEGERASSLRPHPNLYYLSGSQVSNTHHTPLKGWTQMFHVAHTTLFHPFNASIFLKNRDVLRAERNGFMVYINSDCVDYREAAFNAVYQLSKQHKLEIPTAKGKCHGSHPDTSRSENDNEHRLNENVEHMRKFRFALTMENSNVEGYITEKIADAFAAGTIPIYYGTPDVFKLFNKEAFIYYDIHNPQAALDEILHLETNMTAYKEKLQQSILMNGEKTLDDHFSLVDGIGKAQLKQKIRQMLDL